MAEDIVLKLKNMISISALIVFLFPTVKLIPCGGNYCYKCVCPFHDDKNASFYIYKDDRGFICFGCNIKGDIFTLVQLAKGNIDFVGAIDFLCNSFHVERSSSSSKDSEEQKYYKIMKYLVNTFNNCNALAENKGYSLWAKRGFDKAFVDKYRLGICYPPKKDGELLRVLQSKFGDDIDYQGLGIVDYKGNSPFINRLIIPIQDTSGKFVSFTARTFVESDIKYKLMKTNDYYKKQSNLFLYNYCRGSDSFIITEGHMDALTLHMAGYINAVALAGCVFSPTHALHLSGKKIVLALDNDDAGKKATEKILLDYPGYEFYIVKYPEGSKDFNDMLMAGEEIKLDVESDVEFLAKAYIEKFDPYRAMSSIERYLSCKFKKVIHNEDGSKFGTNLLGLDKAIEYVKEKLSITLDLKSILDSVYR